MKSRISSKGQVTVPVQVRKRLGLRPGTEVEFELREGDAVLRKGTPADHPVDVVYGSIELERPVDQLLDDMRGPRARTPTRGGKKRRRASSDE